MTFCYRLSPRRQKSSAAQTWQMMSMESLRHPWTEDEQSLGRISQSPQDVASKAHLNLFERSKFLQGVQMKTESPLLQYAAGQKQPSKKKKKKYRTLGDGEKQRND